MSAAQLILASGSKARISMLQKAGYEFDICPADIDEDTLRKNMKDMSPKEIASALAKEKARVMSEKNPDACVIGSDQICAIGKEIFTKAKNAEDAKIKLKTLQGRTHELHSAVAIYKEGKEVWNFCDTSLMTMKVLSDTQINVYLEKAGEMATICAGAYAIEEIGARLFKHIEGDYFTVLGMPLFPLMAALDKEGFTL